jgi:hypothetical protein
MNDIYKQKAKKYKYKYLKLKKEYIGAGADNNNKLYNLKFSIKKYANQHSTTQKWSDASDWQIELINLKDENKNSIGTYNNNIYIYIGFTEEIINITNIKNRKLCLLSKLPEHSGKTIIDNSELIIINKKIKTNNFEYTKINNNTLDYFKYHNLYYIQSETQNEWHICEKDKIWIRNILPILYNIKYTNKCNYEFLKYLSSINNNIIIYQYLLFEYNNKKYLSFIFEINKVINKDNKTETITRIQFIIIDLDTGDRKIVFYPYPYILNELKDEQRIEKKYKKKLKDLQIIKFFKDNKIPIIELNKSTKSDIEKLRIILNSFEESKENNKNNNLDSHINSLKSQINDLLKVEIHVLKRQKLKEVEELLKEYDNDKRKRKEEERKRKEEENNQKEEKKRIKLEEKKRKEEDKRKKEEDKKSKKEDKKNKKEEDKRKKEEDKRKKEEENIKKEEQTEKCFFNYDISFNYNNNQETEYENKKKYKKLSLLFHPDKNNNTICSIKNFINNELKINEESINNKLLENNNCYDCANVLIKQLNNEYNKYKIHYNIS